MPPFFFPVITPWTSVEGLEVDNPVEEICSKIVRALAKRKWEVEGIKTLVSTAQLNVKGCVLEASFVMKITGENFAIIYPGQFLRVNPQQKEIESDIKVIIPKEEIRSLFFPVLSAIKETSDVLGFGIQSGQKWGMAYTQYVGDEWDKYKKPFLNNMVVNSRTTIIPDVPDTHYTSYRTNFCACRNFSHLAELREEKKAFNRRKPKLLVTDEIFKHFRNWLIKNVLNKIEVAELTPPLFHPDPEDPFFKI